MGKASVTPARRAGNGSRAKLPNTAVLPSLTQPRLLGRVGQGAKEHQHTRCKGLPDLTLPPSQKPAENMSQFLHFSVQGSRRGSRKGWTELTSSSALGERTGWNTALSHAAAKPSQPATGPSAALTRCRRETRGERGLRSATRPPLLAPTGPPPPSRLWPAPRPGVQSGGTGRGQRARWKGRCGCSPFSGSRPRRAARAPQLPVRLLPAAPPERPPRAAAAPSPAPPGRPPPSPPTPGRGGPCPPAAGRLGGQGGQQRSAGRGRAEQDSAGSSASPRRGAQRGSGGPAQRSSGEPAGGRWRRRGGQGWAGLGWRRGGRGARPRRGRAGGGARGARSRAAAAEGASGAELPAGCGAASRAAPGGSMRTAELRSLGKWFGYVASPSSATCPGPDTAGSSPWEPPNSAACWAPRIAAPERWPRRPLRPRRRPGRSAGAAVRYRSPPAVRWGRHAVFRWPPAAPRGASSGRRGAARHLPGARGLPPRRDLPGQAAALGAAPAGGLLVVGSGERGCAPRGAAPTAAGSPGRGACAGCEARGGRQWPEAFPAAGAGRFCGGRRERGRALQRGAADRAFSPRWGEPPPGRARGCRAAASWVARTKGPRRERAGAPPLLPGASSPERDGGRSAHPGLPHSHSLGSAAAASAVPAPAPQPPPQPVVPLPGRGCRWGGQCSPAGHPGGRAGSPGAARGGRRQPGASGRRRQWAGAFAFAVVSAPRNC